MEELIKNSKELTETKKKYGNRESIPKNKILWAFIVKYTYNTAFSHDF